MTHWRTGVAALVLLVGACGGESSEVTVGSALTTRPGAPDVPGALLTGEELDEPSVDGTVWRIRYRSESVSGDPVEVTGIIARPPGPAPAGGFPVVSVAHSTSGIADGCAPSRSGVAWVPWIGHLLDAGFVVAASDYEGLGGEGVHPYLLATSEGRSVLDAARAARHVVPEANETLVVLGFSQGGHAALASAEIATEWAPELRLAGTVAVAPVGDVERLVNGSYRSAATFGFVVLVAAGWADAYDDLDEADILGPRGRELADAARDDACASEVFQATASSPIEDLQATPPEQLPAWQRRLADSAIDPAAVTGPVLVVHGTDDALIPVSSSDELVAGLCEAGVAVRYETHEGADHGTVFGAAEADIDAWVTDRLAGAPAESTC